MSIPATVSNTPRPVSTEHPAPEEALLSVNPASGELIRSYPAYSLLDVERRLDRAAAAFHLWKAQTLSDRCEVIEAAADELLSRRQELAALMTVEMGKPITQAEGEIDKCVWLCRHYVSHAAAYLAPEDTATEARFSCVRFDPLGVILLIMPWNYPFWQVLRCAVPALLAGNTVVLKHSPNVSGCALAVESILRDTKVVPDIFTTLLLQQDHADMLITHPSIQGVSLTGSDRAGRDVAALAGRFLKKTVLELGGSDPFLVLDDAPVRYTAL